ncbi:hypothetical protein NIES2104_04900 [Leptolyngbya sp. NIES-2104]|nr:hypothetical protein NIES2104_04900 [Leptolyngbya sp. NIES-2104]
MCEENGCVCLGLKFSDSTKPNSCSFVRFGFQIAEKALARTAIDESKE